MSLPRTFFQQQMTARLLLQLTNLVTNLVFAKGAKTIIRNVRIVPLMSLVYSYRS